MKPRTFIICMLVLFSGSRTFAQPIARHMSDEGNMYPIVTMNSLISWYNMALTDWERNMKLLSKIRDDYGKEGGIVYTIQNKDGTGDGWFFATKKTDAVEVVYNIGTNKKSLFGDLMRDLKPYYVKDLDGNQVYSFKHLDEPEYIFIVNMTAESEYVKMYINTSE